MTIVTRSLLFWLVVTSGIALVWPVERFGFDPFRASTWHLWALIVVTMLALGTLVRRDELRPLRQHPWWVVLGVATQLIVMPAAAWLMTRLFPLPEEIAAGVILVGCVPGAMASNVLTNLARGSVAYSVSLTTIATLVSPVTVPALLWIVTGFRSDQSLTKPAVQLAMLVVLPTVVGFLASRRWRRIRDAAARLSPPVASVALLWIITAVVAKNRESLGGVSLMLLVALLLINVSGYLAGWIVGRTSRLPPRYGRALTLEVGMQNAGLGTVLASSMHPESTAVMIPTAAYTFGCMLTGTLLAGLWRRAESVEESAGTGVP